MSLQSEKKFFSIVFRYDGTWFFFVNTELNKISLLDLDDYIYDFLTFIDTHIYNGQVGYWISQGMSWSELSNDIAENYRSDNVETHRKIIAVLDGIDRRCERLVSQYTHQTTLESVICALNMAHYGKRKFLDTQAFREIHLPVLVDYFKNYTILKKL